MSSFRNRKYAKQLIDFKGIKYGKCQASDIDMSLDWQGNVFVFVEYKYEGAGMSLGQKFHLQNLVSVINAGGKRAVAILATHKTPTEVDVDAGAATVAQVYTGGKGWDKGPSGISVNQYLNGLYDDYMEKRSNA